MSTPASIARHPIHPILVAFPIGLWVFAFVCDLIYQWGAHNPFWRDSAFYAMIGGLIGAVIAAVPGLVDYLTIVNRQVKRIGTAHLVLNLAVVVLYAVNIWIRRTAMPEATGPVWLSLVSLILLVVSGWLGGEMVYVHGVGVEPYRTSPTIDMTQPRPDEIRRPA